MKTRVLVSAKDRADALTEVAREIQSAQAKHGHNGFITPHEALGVISEEWDEFKEAVHGNDTNRQIKELIQVAAMATYAVASIMAAGAKWNEGRND